MIGIPIGLALSNITEWAVHKYVLHGLGKDRTSWWAFHWHEHHGKVRRSGGRDPDYEAPFWALSPRRREALALAVVGLAHVPLLPVAPFFTATVWWRGLRYYQLHKRAHLDVAWSRAHLPWHYDHHMGPDQDRNWCVTHPWFDEVMGTRAPYAGTAREAADQAKRAAREAARAASGPPATC
jgi:sterol desaturase/sphingolipid hydroxylase (fatty acid hydroxylase superfamily)